MKKIIILCLCLILLFTLSACGRFSGRWYDINGDEDTTRLEFIGTNQLVLSSGDGTGGYVLPYSVKGNSVLITVPSLQNTFYFELVKIDGVNHIRGKFTGYTEYDFVPEKDYETLKPVSP